MRVLEELGRGGRSVVYCAERDGTRYAVKVVADAGAGDDAVAFRREAAMLACLRHPGLVRVHEVGVVDGRSYLVMDLVEGRPLDAAIGAGTVAEQWLAGAAAEVVAALAVAHQAGLVHRDIKPENIMIGPDGHARLIDFGLAGRLGMQAADAAVGTFAYSAPEQTGMLRRPVDGRTDLYALGVVLYEALAGERPFQADDAGELIRLHLSSPAPELRLACPQVSPAMAALVGRLLVKDPDDRYQTAHGLMADLTRIAAGERDFPLGTGDVPGRGLDPALVGRRDEIDQLRGWWHAASAGHGRLVLVEGLPGAGKSRVVRELVATAGAAGQLTLYGKHERASGTPLAAVRDAVDGYLREVRRLPDAARADALARLRALARPAATLLAALSPAMAAVLAGEGRSDAPAEPAGAGAGDEERFARAVAVLLADLARSAGAALVQLDDVHWIDPASRRVLRHLVPLLRGTPLLLVLTARDDTTSRDGVDELTAELAAAAGNGPDGGPDGGPPRLRLGPLPPAAVADLLASGLGGSAAPPPLVERVVAATGGNPLAASEYLRAVVDAGLLRPSWGGWLLDEAGLARLALPENVLDLLLRRVDGLSAAARAPLTAAAAIGRFTPALVAAASGADPPVIATALADAAAHRLVVPGAAGRYVFAHDQIREALLADLDDAARRRLHQRIAEELERLGGDGPEHVFEVAQHYLAGEADRTPELVFRAAAAAGAQALRRQAPTDAFALLNRAAAAAEAAGLTPGSAFLADLGTAAARVGRLDLALEQLQRALDGEPDPLRRAALHCEMAGAHHLRWDGARTLEAARRGLAEAGHRLPDNMLVLLLSTIALAVRARLRPRRRVVTGPRAERYRLQAMLLNVCAQGASAVLQPLLSGLVTVRSRHVSGLVRPCPEYAFNRAGLALFARMMGRRRRAEQLLEEAVAAARSLHDPGPLARVEMMRGIIEGLILPAGATSGDVLRQVLRAHGRWLDTAEFVQCVGGLVQLALLRGNLADAEEWHAQAADRVGGADRLAGNLNGPIGAQVAALAGRPAEASRLLELCRAALGATPDNIWQRLTLAVAAAGVAVEQGEVGDVLDAAVADFRALGHQPRQLLTGQRAFWVYQAFGRLAQVAAAPPDRREQALAAADRAVRELRRAAAGPVLRAYHAVSLASLDQLRGDHRRALRRLYRVAARASGLDLPLLEYEMARIRARALTGLGHRADAARQAAVALGLAIDFGWQARARWVRAEFGLAAGSPNSVAAPAPRSQRASGSVQDIHQRRLQAVHQVGLAAATVLDPAQLARVALDEIVKIFGAERAFLFLYEADGNRLIPYLGRDAGRRDLGELTGYGSTLVERVRQSTEAVVVTGTEQGAALGSRSTLAHGLRSIMISPLLLRGRLQGVVYLDSRAAKGIFTADDVEILTAITNHIALALQTARTAQLELDVRTAERERDVAELLQRAMAALGASLEPTEVAGVLLSTVVRWLPVEAAALLIQEPDGHPRLIARLPDPEADPGAGADPTSAPDPDPTSAPDPDSATGTGTGTGTGGGGSDARGIDIVAADPALAALLDAPAACAGTSAAAPPPAILGPAGTAWLAVPMVVRGEPRGLLVAGTSADRPYTGGEIQLAAALVEQGAMAYQNALLFQQVHNLAVRDELTGLFNRRHFFQAGPRQLAPGRRTAAAIMVDIDHFKAINDSHGHGTGDDVIHQVAQRLTSSLRATDLLCRYGGEEFAVLLPNTTPEQARTAAARLHAVVAGAPVPTRTGPVLVTVSVGLADSGPATTDLDALLQQADAALYQAKAAGRDRIAVYAAPSPHR
jgi:diguanylate cyclase (GGDEF)-like protein